MISANIPNDVRKAVYMRDGYRCALCDSTRGLQVHHCIKRSQGGSNGHHNLITLCWRCHAEAHGTRLADTPRQFDCLDIATACIAYVSDYYAEQGIEWCPFEWG